MLPPDVNGVSAGHRAGPACRCTQKPLPCLVDNWVTEQKVPYEQPLSIQTDMEYTLDTRMFPGWDPVTGITQPALVVDTAVLTARSQAAAAPGISASAAATGTTTRTTRRSSQNQRASRYRETTNTTNGAWASRTPIPQAPEVPTTAYHPAFRPAEPLYRPPTQQFRHHRPLIQQDGTVFPQPQQHATTADTDMLALIASLDVEPVGYTLDVDWLIGQSHPTQHQAAPPASAAYASAITRNAPLQHPVMTAQAQQHQTVRPVSFPPSEISEYQSQFYPGASWGALNACTNLQNPHMVGISGGACIVGTSASNATVAASAINRYLPASVLPSVGKTRGAKRRLPVDSPCEASLPVAFIDLTLPTPTTKRARWESDWNGAYSHGMGGLSHVPSPLQNRAY